MSESKNALQGHDSREIRAAWLWLTADNLSEAEGGDASFLTCNEEYEISLFNSVYIFRTNTTFQGGKTTYNYAPVIQLSKHNANIQIYIILVRYSVSKPLYELFPLSKNWILS